MQARAMIRPGSTVDVSLCLKLCEQAGQPVITHGGLTGCVEGTVTGNDYIVLTLERMNAIEDIDVVGGTMTVQAGVILEAAQQAAKDQGLYFPLDLGARGSCMIGGNIATNAGGINVIRYGMIRNSILGLEAVLADGTVLSSMNRMLKNNSGYDLKQLFIGTEGTLGVVTRAVIKLAPLPNTRETALLALASFEDVTNCLSQCQKAYGPNLSAYEVMWGGYYQAVTAEGWNVSPLSGDYPFYVVVEYEGMDASNDDQRFMSLMERLLTEEIVEDAVIAQSEAVRKVIWETRENFEAITSQTPYFLYDVSLPIRDMKAYVDEVEARMIAEFPGGDCFVLGHIGDGNLHFFIVPRTDDPDAHLRSDRHIYEPLKKYHGAVSAEHGIGREKRRWLGLSRTDNEIQLMKRLKTTLDPKGILNPGLIFE